ncbi:COPI associated protein-domain-containing protein [Phycomyces nitens]|nr:COPI associated protein-domain-containing protein [Phycomyces nitens]
MLSRTKVENILSLGLNGMNISLYLLVIASTIVKCLNANFSQIVMGIYGIIIAALLVVNEFHLSNVSIDYFPFLSLYRGRGMVLIFFGCLVLDVAVVNIIAGTLNLAFGFLYIIMSYIPSYPPLRPIGINWQNWKDFSAEGLDLIGPKHMAIESNVAMRLKSPPPFSQHVYPYEADIGDIRTNNLHKEHRITPH